MTAGTMPHEVRAGQEVGFAKSVLSPCAYHGIEDGEVGFQILAKANKGPLVAHLVAVVGGRKNGDALALVILFVPIVLALVGANK